MSDDKCPRCGVDRDHNVDWGCEWLCGTLRFADGSLDEGKGCLTNQRDNLVDLLRRLIAAAVAWYEMQQETKP